MVQAQLGTKEELSFCSNLWEEQSMKNPGIKQDEHALFTCRYDKVIEGLERKKKCVNNV